MRNLVRAPRQSSGKGLAEHTRHMLYISASIVIGGVIFLLFWQGVVTFQPRPVVTLDSESCFDLIRTAEPRFANANWTRNGTSSVAYIRSRDLFKTAIIEFSEGNKFLGCSIEYLPISASPRPWQETYNCEDFTVRWSANNKNSYWIIEIETEENETFVFENETFEIGSLVPLTYKISWLTKPEADKLLESLRKRSCDII